MVIKKLFLPVTVFILVILIVGFVITKLPRSSGTVALIPGMQSHTSLNGFYKLQLPSGWVAHVPYDGSVAVFTQLEDGVFSYGSKDKSRVVWVESFSVQSF